MAKRVLLVHNDRHFAAQVRDALLNAGQEVTHVVDPFRALDEMERGFCPDLLITRVRHGDGKPNGIALARMARFKYPSMAVVVVGAGEFAELADGLGVFLSTPVAVPEVVHVATGLLDNAQRSVSGGPGPMPRPPGPTQDHQGCCECERDVIDVSHKAAG